jgi:hypothetical protein
MKNHLALAAAALLPLLSACTADPNPAGPSAAPTAATSPDLGTTASATPEPSTTGPDTAEARVRFTAGDAEIIVRTADNPTSRDFVSMLPLTLDFQDFAGNEKISYLPRRLTTEGSTGSSPANGDLTYYVPWGNLAFFYNADGGYSDQLIMIGTIESGYELLDDLEDGPVTVDLIT